MGCPGHSRQKPLTSEELARGAVQVFWLDVGGIQHLMAKLQVAINKTNNGPVMRNENHEGLFVPWNPIIE